MADWIRSTHVRNMAETTQAGLQKARMEAMKRNRVVTFWMVSRTASGGLDDSCALSATSGAWVVSMADPAGKCATAPSETAAPRIIETYTPGKTASGITVSGLAANGATAATAVTFNGYGQIERTGTPLARIDISHTDASARRLRVEISNSGSIRMCDRDVTAPDPRACTGAP
jgi:type IV fimbrial biogenesis protein FimT